MRKFICFLLLFGLFLPISISANDTGWVCTTPIEDNYGNVHNDAYAWISTTFFRNNVVDSLVEYHFSVLVFKDYSAWENGKAPITSAKVVHTGQILPETMMDSLAVVIEPTLLLELDGTWQLRTE